MIPFKKELKFLPGQFVFVSFIGKNISKEAHPFSISSSNNGLLKIAIKELGDYTKKIKSLEKGDKVLIEGPYGRFNFKNFSEKQIWIVGGIGIVPFLSMTRSLTSKDSNYKIDMYYSVKDNNSFILSEELIQVSKSNANFKINFWETDKQGFITAEAIKKTNLKISDCDILICGPQTMMTELKKQFLKLGVKKNRIQTEEFQLY
jgi:predicted ferric reductase